MQLRVEGVKVLVEADKAEETYGMIILPKTAVSNRQYIMNIGTVLAIGPLASCTFYIKDGEVPDEEGTTTRSLRVGDKVWFAKYGGASFEYSKREDRDRDLRILNDMDIMGIIDDDLTPKND
jgi:co-chaperonin GroES (HSP10)